MSHAMESLKKGLKRNFPLREQTITSISILVSPEEGEKKIRCYDASEVHSAIYKEFSPNKLNRNDTRAK